MVAPRYLGLSLRRRGRPACVFVLREALRHRYGQSGQQSPFGCLQKEGNLLPATLHSLLSQWARYQQFEVAKSKGEIDETRDMLRHLGGEKGQKDLPDQGSNLGPLSGYRNEYANSSVQLPLCYPEVVV